MDSNGDGQLSLGEFRSAIRKLGVVVSDADTTEMFLKASGGQELINQRQFLSNVMDGPDASDAKYRAALQQQHLPHLQSRGIFAGEYDARANAAPASSRLGESGSGGGSSGGSGGSGGDPWARTGTYGDGGGGSHEGEKVDITSPAENTSRYEAAKRISRKEVIAQARVFREMLHAARGREGDLEEVRRERERRERETRRETRRERRGEKKREEKIRVERRGEIGEVPHTLSVLYVVLHESAPPYICWFVCRVLLYSSVLLCVHVYIEPP